MKYSVTLKILFRITCSCNIYPLIPHFYIGYAGVYLFFLFLLQNIDCGYSLEPPHNSAVSSSSSCCFGCDVLFEPPHEKTICVVFEQVRQRIGLYKHRRWLETGNFGFRMYRYCTISVVKTKVMISFEVTAKLICVFFRICRLLIFLMRRLILIDKSTDLLYVQEVNTKVQKSIAGLNMQHFPSLLIIS